MAKLNPRKFKAVSNNDEKKSSLVDEKSGKILVEKEDGSIGEWGNDLKPKPKTSKAKLYPSGELSDEDYEKLKSLKNRHVDRALSRPVTKEGYKPMYGTEDSDVIKSALKQSK